MPQSRGRRHKPGEKARKRARAQRRNADPDYWVCMQFGAVADVNDAESVEQVKQVTHDRVLAATAGRITSGVSWRIIPAAEHLDACRELIATAGGEDPDAVKAREGLLDYLEATETAGLIVASVDVLRQGQDRGKANLS